LSGKSTLFSAITGQPVDVAKALLEHSAMIKVPDDRLAYLTQLYRPKKTTEATIEFCDFPGISSADDSGKERYRKHLPQIRQCDVLVTVVRAFANDAVLPFRDRIDAQGDVAAVADDLLFADLETVSTRIDRLQSALKKPTRRHDEEKRELALLEACQAALEDMKPLSTVLEGAEGAHLLRSFALLTEKPLILVVNASEQSAAAKPAIRHEHAHAVLAVCAQAEADIARLDAADRQAFMDDLGIVEPARNRLIRTCYEAAGLISFLTTGEDEVRAWPVRRGSSAVEAAGKIHSDIARGFIRAETMAYDDLKTAGGDVKAVRAAGKLRQEGKEYTVKDGDIIHFKFNV
jgi:GTP-binding protein YchF